MSDHITSNASGLRSFGRAIRKAAPITYNAARASIRKAGHEVAAEAKSEASWSTRIPGTIKAVPSGALAMIVRAGGVKAPHAPLLEHGGRPGTFRHPLFGNRSYWYNENARPFLHPALLHKLGIFRDLLTAAVVNAVKDSMHESFRNFEEGKHNF